MAEPNALLDGLKLAGTAVGGLSLTYIVGQFVAGLLKSWISGIGPQEKELRGDLATEVKRLGVDLSAARDEIDELRQDIRRLSRMYLHVLTTRAEARAALNALERLQGLPLTPFTPDPPETLNAPGGPP